MPKHIHIFLMFLSVQTIVISCSQIGERKHKTTSVKPVFFSDFRSPNPEQNWKYTTLDNQIIKENVSDFNKGKLSFDYPNILQSPKFELDPLKYYQLKFSAKASEKSYWAVVFFDKDGEMLLADVYSSIDPSDELQNFTFYFQAKADATEAQVWFRPDGEDTKMEIQKVNIIIQKDHQVIKDWADSVYAEIPPLETVIPPPGREKYIPKTMEALKTGEKIRVVMLGNSIINDTGSSAWEILLKDHWPKADVEVITSVRGGTGCWYYQKNNRIDTFVVKYKPDLLIIGGISQRGDTAAIHSVINQVREKSSPEILVFTGPVGRGGDPRSNPDFKIPAEPGDYRVNLKTMADDANVGYWDMQTEWGKYIQSSGKPYDYYLRDPVHANSRGRQILARLMCYYFAPTEK